MQKLSNLKYLKFEYENSKNTKETMSSHANPFFEPNLDSRWGLNIVCQQSWLTLLGTR